MTSKQLFFSLCLSLLVGYEGISQVKTPELEINLKAVPGLTFDQLRFRVSPGAHVKLTLTNNDDMDHNLLITKPNKRQEVVNAAMALQDKGPSLNFIPRSESVLWAIPIISPGEKHSLSFVAPTETGAYPYVCTYPGHGFIMYGVMYVTNDEMPPLATDPNIPASRKENAGAHASHSSVQHLNHKSTPYLYRTFIEDIGPAAIAVRLTKNLSYGWDAAQCRFRYAWEGGFLDIDKLWAGHKQATAKVLGDILFADETEYPLRIGESGNIPDVKFRGYQLIDGYPEFHYSINGVNVHELIKEKPDGSGLVRIFRIPDATQNVWFFRGNTLKSTYESSVGKWVDNVLKLTPNEAKNFTITLTKTKAGIQ